MQGNYKIWVRNNAIQNTSKTWEIAPSRVHLSTKWNIIKKQEEIEKRYRRVQPSSLVCCFSWGFATPMLLSPILPACKRSKDEGARGAVARCCNIVKRAFQKRSALACALQTMYNIRVYIKKGAFDRDISSSPQWMFAGSAKLFNMSAAASGESPKDAISPKLDQITWFSALGKGR